MDDAGAAALLAAIRSIWDSARVQAEQGGKVRAEYNRRLLETLSGTLEMEYGSGFSVSALKYMRLFYLGYPELLEMRHAVRDESAPTGGEEWQPGRLHAGLSWTHYRTLPKVERRDPARNGRAELGRQPTMNRHVYGNAASMPGSTAIPEEMP